MKNRRAGDNRTVSLLASQERDDRTSWLSVLKRSWQSALHIDQSKITAVQAIRGTLRSSNCLKAKRLTSYYPTWEYDAAAYYQGNYRTHIAMNVSATATCPACLIIKFVMKAILVIILNMYSKSSSLLGKKNTSNTRLS